MPSVLTRWVDQDIGVLAAIHRPAPAAGFDVVREVSQCTNTKLHTVAETVIAWALGQPMAEPVGRELEKPGRAAVSTAAGCREPGDRVEHRRARYGSGGQGLFDGGVAADDLVHADELKNSQHRVQSRRRYAAIPECLSWPGGRR
ncbi:hypothetical protein SALBM311S_01008 [Streptomyces alboniger]